ncbi:transposase [Streptomyces sp. ME08-AFT2]|uniref:transposase n=1 Tax=Streptomyces sp. ME08-AFT2 TaxID=3028683 RepID=UPI0039F6AD05
MREIVNAILYQNRTGCQWEFLPHDMPPPGAGTARHLFRTPPASPCWTASPDSAAAR